MVCTGYFLGAPDHAGLIFVAGTERLNPKPQQAESSPAITDLCSQQLVARICVLLERRLIGGVRRALGGDHARGGTASYSFGSDESGNLGIAIVVRHNLSLRAG
jgi:hypothetical protein